MNLGGPSLENGDVEALLLIDDWAGVAPATGTWTIAFEGEEIGDTGEYHAWLADDSQVGSVFPYLSTNADNRYLIGKPGSAINGITVGSYSAHDATTRFRTSWTDVNGIGRTDTSALLGDISDFSSTGKTRDRRVKPEVTAPGERVLGAVSKDAFPGIAPNSIYRFHPFAEATGLLTDATPNHAFGLLQGTSFSAPVVAGLAARILSTSPTLDAVQVRNVLINSATTDVSTGAVPNDMWGYGKVSLTVGGVTLPGKPSHHDRLTGARRPERGLRPGAVGLGRKAAVLLVSRLGLPAYGPEPGRHRPPHRHRHGHRHLQLHRPRHRFYCSRSGRHESARDIRHRHAGPPDRDFGSTPRPLGSAVRRNRGGHGRSDALHVVTGRRHPPLWPWPQRERPHRRRRNCRWQVRLHGSGAGCVGRDRVQGGQAQGDADRIRCLGTPGRRSERRQPHRDRRPQPGSCSLLYRQCRRSDPECRLR